MTSYLVDLAADLPKVSPDGLDMTVLGMLCSPSLGHIQCSLSHFQQNSVVEPLNFSLLWHDNIELSKPVTERVQQLMYGETLISEPAELNILVARELAAAARTLCSEKNFDLSKVDIIASHGAKVWMQARAIGEGEKSVYMIGDGAIVAAETGRTTVTSFCISDLAAGRDGIPPTALFTALLLHHPTKIRAVHHFDTLSSACFMPPDFSGGVTIAYDFDTGLGTIFTSYAVRHFSTHYAPLTHDNDGANASRGTVNQSLVDAFLKHPYFSILPPKRASSETFSHHLAEELITRAESAGMSPDDIIATLTRITAQNIVDCYSRWSPDDYAVDEMFVAGPGESNRAVLSYISSAFPDMRILPLVEAGIPGAVSESIGFAWQGLETIVGRPVPLSVRASGRRDTVLGKIRPGENFREMMSMGMTFGDGAKQLQPTRHVVNWVDGKEFDNKW